MAFEAVLKLWNKKPLKSYGVKISESVLVILCSILKGESIINEKLAKEKATVSTPSTAPNSNLVTPTPLTNDEGTSSSNNAPSSGEEPVPPTPLLVPYIVDGPPEDVPPSSSFSISHPPPPAESNAERPEGEPSGTLQPASSQEPSGQQSSAVEPAPQHPYLQSLLDMGFSQDRCLEAITHSHTLEQATEYLLANPIAGVPAAGDRDMDYYSEEDHQWLEAVALSLQDNQTGSQTTPKVPSEVSAFVAAVENEEPLNKSQLDEFTSTVLDGCLDQLDAQPQLVYKVCELLTTCVARNGESWRENMLKTLIAQIQEQATELSLIASQGSNPDTTEYICASSTALKFGVRLHLLTLLFEEMKSGCAGALEEVNLVDLLVDLLCVSQEVMSSNPQVLIKISADQAIKEQAKKSNTKDKPKEINTDTPYTPKWLAPAMLLLDLHEKLSVALGRRIQVKKVSSACILFPYHANSENYFRLLTTSGNGLK